MRICGVGALELDDHRQYVNTAHHWRHADNQLPLRSVIFAGRGAFALGDILENPPA
jgi:hypothetical protein